MIFLDWIYDESIVYLPTPSDHSSQHSNFEPQFEHLTNSQRQTGFEILKHRLRETGYTGRVQKTTSYKTLNTHSRCNIRSQVVHIIRHVLKLLLEDDAEDVWAEVLVNSESNSFTDQR